MASKKLPANLTNKEWQKAKGVLGKLTLGKTDLGAQLTALEKEWDSSVFGKGVPAYTGVDPKEFADSLKPGKDALTKDLASLKAKITAVEKAAQSVADDAKKDKKVPASIGKYVSSLVTNLNNLANEVTEQVGMWESQEKKGYKDRFAKSKSVVILTTALPKMLTKYNMIYKNISAVQAEPTRAAIASEFGTDCPARSLTTACQTWDQVIAVELPSIAKSIYGGKAMADYFAQPLLSPFATIKGGEVVEKMMESSGKSERQVTLACMKTLKDSVDKAGDVLQHMKGVAAAVAAVK